MRILIKMASKIAQWITMYFFAYFMLHHTPYLYILSHCPSAFKYSGKENNTIGHTLFRLLIHGNFTHK